MTDAPMTWTENGSASVQVLDEFYNAVRGVRWSFTRIEAKPMRLGRALHRAWRKLNAPAHWPKSHTRYRAVHVSGGTTGAQPTHQERGQG